MSSIEELAAAVGGNAEQAREVASSLSASKDQADQFSGELAAMGLEGKATEAQAVADDLESLTGQQLALAEQIDQARARTEALRGLLTGGSGTVSPPGGPTTSGTASGRPEVGEWANPPRRSHGNPFNARYEQWVKVSNGGPDDEREYRVRGVWFDARRFERTPGASTEILLDAKGQYDKFIDKDGDWKEFFQKFEKSGIEGLVAEARRQVDAAGGQPVEWWCAEKDSARLIRRRFRQEPDLSGRVTVRHMPMPDEER